MRIFAHSRSNQPSEGFGFGSTTERTERTESFFRNPNSVRPVRSVVDLVFPYDGR